MNKVIVTGLGIGNDFGVCGCCDLDFSWLVRNPSTLIWADKIIITSNAWKAQMGHSEDKFNKAVNLILQIADGNGLIEIVNPKDIFAENIGEKIYANVESDIINLERTFPELIKKSNEKIPDEILINDVPYCGPYVASIYASIKLGEELQANCLLNDSDYEFLKFRYGLSLYDQGKYQIPQIFDEVFTLYLPNELVLHNYAYCSDKLCDNCKKERSCRDSYLLDIEKNTNKIIGWRDYDEILAAKKEIEKIIDVRKMYGKELDPEEVKRDFCDRQKKINRKINKIFPKIRRWTNLTTVIATPLSIYGAAAGNPVTAIAGGAALGAARATEEIMKYYESKNNWIGFINNQSDLS